MFSLLYPSNKKVTQIGELTIMKILITTALLGGAAFLSGCASDNSTVNTKQKAVMGGVGGAIVGGIIGHQSGRGLEGAAVGAGAGAAGGAVMGSAQDEKEAMQNRR